MKFCMTNKVKVHRKQGECWSLGLNNIIKKVNKGDKKTAVSRTGLASSR